MANYKNFTCKNESGTKTFEFFLEGKVWEMTFGVNLICDLINSVIKNR